MEKEGIERQKETYVGYFLSAPQAPQAIEPAISVMFPDRESNPQPFCVRDNAPLIEPLLSPLAITRSSF